MSEDTVVESVADDGLESVADSDEGDGGGETQEQPKGEDVPPQAPVEEYELVAGDDFPVPEENLKSFTAAAREAGLSKAQAEAMLAWHKGFHGDVTKAAALREQQIIAGWQRELMTDPEFGGDNYRATIADGRRALREMDPDGSLRALLKEQKADFHPVVVRAIARVGRAMREHEVIGNRSGGGRSSTPLEERMWPDMK